MTRSAFGLVIVVGLGIVLAGCGARTGGTVNAAPGAAAASAPVAAVVARAAAPDSADVFSAEFLARTADQLGTATGKTVGETGTRKYMVGRRVVSGVPEVHDRWTDLALVQGGRATLVSGGRVEGGREESPGEHRGGTIVGGTSRLLGPGDLLVIPAGVPHQYVLQPGDTLRYLTLKVLEGAR